MVLEPVPRCVDVRAPAPAVPGDGEPVAFIARMSHGELVYGGRIPGRLFKHRRLLQPPGGRERDRWELGTVAANRVAGERTPGSERHAQLGGLPRLRSCTAVGSYALEAVGSNPPPTGPSSPANPRARGGASTIALAPRVTPSAARSSDPSRARRRARVWPSAPTKTDTATITRSRWPERWVWARRPRSVRASETRWLARAPPVAAVAVRGRRACDGCRHTRLRAVAGGDGREGRLAWGHAS